MLHGRSFRRPGRGALRTRRTRTVVIARTARTHLARLCASVVFLAVVATRGGAQTPPASPPAPIDLATPFAVPSLSPHSARDIFIIARARWLGIPEPPYLDYTVTLRGSHKDRSFDDRFHVLYRSVDRKSIVETISLTGEQPPKQDLRRQVVFPDDTFGFVERRRNYALPTSVSAETPSPRATALPEIVAVTAMTQLPYEPSLIGRERVRGREAYHLLLSPRFDPKRFPLHDAWIDATTFDVVRVRANADRPVGRLTAHVAIVCDYGRVGPYRLIRSIDAEGSARVLFASYTQLAHARYDEIFAPRDIPELDLEPPTGAATPLVPTVEPTPGRG